MQILFLALTGAQVEGILSVNHPLFLGNYAPRGEKWCFATKEYLWIFHLPGSFKEVPRIFQGASKVSKKTQRLQRASKEHKTSMLKSLQTADL